MLVAMLTQLPLPTTPEPAVEIAPGVGLVEGDAGGVVWVHGLATFAWDGGDETGRRLAAVQLVRVKAATQVQVAVGFGVDATTVARWDHLLTSGGVVGLVPGRRGPKGASKLKPELMDRIRELDGSGWTHTAIAAEVGVSTFSVRTVLGPKRSRPAATPPAEADTAPTETSSVDTTNDDTTNDDTTNVDTTNVDTTNDDTTNVDTTNVDTTNVDTTNDDTTNDEAASGEAVSEQAAEIEAMLEAGRVLPVLPDPVSRRGERALAPWGLLGEGAVPVFRAGARYPLAGLLLALPGLQATGLLATARATYKRLRDGFYGLDTMLIVLVFLALLREPRAEGATRVPPGDLGRVVGLDRAPEVKTIRRKLGELARAGKAADWMVALAGHHATMHPDAVGFLYVDGHTRVYTGTRTIQATHVARLKFPAPATVETWVTDAAGDPLFVVMAEPSSSLASELVRLAPDLRRIVGAGRRVTVCFDRGGWSPAVFADLIEAGFDILTYRKGAIPDLAHDAFTTVEHVDDHARTARYVLADTSVELAITDGKRKGQTVALRQVTRAKADRHGQIKQIHILTSRTDLAAAQVAQRMFSRWRQENYFRYARMHFDLDALDCYAATGDDLDRAVPNPGKKATAATLKNAHAAVLDAATARDAALLALRSPTRGQPVLISNQTMNAVNAPVQQATDHLAAAKTDHAETPARVRLGDLAPDMMVLDTETKLITHAIRMAAYNTETSLARALHGHYARAQDEAYTLIREALASSGDIEPRDGHLHVTLDPLSAPRRTAALAAVCDQLNATRTRYPGTDLVLHYKIKPNP
jgi:hypothetical protein